MYPKVVYGDQIFKKNHLIGYDVLAGAEDLTSEHSPAREFLHFNHAQAYEQRSLNTPHRLRLQSS